MEAAQITTRHVLIVEDEPTMRSVVAWTLEDEGWVVEAVADGPEALESARRRRPALVILDMGLPTLGGDGVASGLRDSYGRSVPILVMTADGKAAEKAARVGAFGYLSKPFELNELVRAVRRGLSEAG